MEPALGWGLHADVSIVGVGGPQFGSFYSILPPREADPSVTNQLRTRGPLVPRLKLIRL
jgi:hypothetical protein